MEECCRVLLSVARCYRVLHSVTQCYRVEQSITEYYRVLQNISSASTWTNFWACSQWKIYFTNHTVTEIVFLGEDCSSGNSFLLDDGKRLLPKVSDAADVNFVIFHDIIFLMRINHSNEFLCVFYRWIWSLGTVCCSEIHMGALMIFFFGFSFFICCLFSYHLPCTLYK